MRKRVVITGVGVLSPIGTGKEKFWNSSLLGRSGIGKITKFDASNYTTRIAGEVKDFDPRRYISGDRIGKIDRALQFAIAASKMAIDDANLDLESEDKGQIGVCMGSGFGAMFLYERQLSILYLNIAQNKSQTLLEQNILSSQISKEFDLKGPNITISTACSTGNHAIGQAFNLIRSNKAEVMIAGASEASILPLTLAGFCSLRLMSKRNDDPEGASRPFDKDRDGFVMGEGAGVMVLETLDHAKRREADIYAEVIGYGMTSDAYHMVMPAPDGKEVARTMKLALEDAKVTLSSIDYINAHGTSTQANDIKETEAIKRVFGDYAYKIPISSTKSMIGHTIGAAGAIELIVCALAVKNDIIPPTINYENPDPKCDLDYVPNVNIEKQVNVALSNSFGFGGNNSTLVIRKCKS